MADSNWARDAYVNKEQDKFFHCLNRQRSDIDALKEHVEQLELRARALELENKFVIGAGLWSASLGLAFNPNDHAFCYSVWFPPDSNPRPGFSASLGISGWSAGVRVSMGAGHVMAYVAIGLR